MNGWKLPSCHHQGPSLEELWATVSMPLMPTPELAFKRKSFSGTKTSNCGTKPSHQLKTESTLDMLKSKCLIYLTCLALGIPQSLFQIQLMVALASGRPGALAPALVELGTRKGQGFVIVQHLQMEAGNVLAVTLRIKSVTSINVQWMVASICGVSGVVAAGLVALGRGARQGCVTTQLPVVEENPALGSTRDLSPVTSSSAQLMEDLVHGPFGVSAARVVDLETRTGQGNVTILPLLMEVIPAWETSIRTKFATANPAQFMAVTVNGPNGLLVARLVELESVPAQGNATTPSLNMVAMDVLGNHSRKNFVINTIAQLMEYLDSGLTGLHAPSLVELDLEIGQGTVITQHLNLVVNHALATSSSKRTVTLITVQELVTGVSGLLGASALCHVELGGTPGTGSVTTHPLPLEGRTVKAKNKKRELVTLKCAQLMDNLDIGATGVAAARLVVLDLEAGTGSVTALLLNMVASLVSAISRKMNNVTQTNAQKMEHGANGSPGPTVISLVELGGKLDIGSATTHCPHSEEPIAKATSKKRLPVTLNSAQ